MGQAASEGQHDRRDISVTSRDNAGNEVRRWYLHGCWPRRWRTSPLDGQTDAVAFEALTFVVERLEIA